MNDPETLNWLRQVHEQTRWTTSVCTGSLILAAAGLLQGRRATTHWLAREPLRRRGVEVVSERIVVDGKIATAAGVSAGIDLALYLAGQIAGEETAQALQLAIEYDPQPPYDVGSREKAALPIVERATRMLTV